MSENRNIKTFSLVSIGLFLAVLILPTVIWVFGKLLPGKPINVLNFDLGENRNMAAFPAEFSSTYGLDLEAFYNDRLPFRSVIISANRGLTAITEKPYDERISPFLVKTFYNKLSEDGTAAIDYMPPKVYNNLTIQGRDGWLFFAKEENLNDYLGNNILSTEEMDQYLSLMVELQELCDEKGKELYFIIPPNKAQVYPEKMPSYTIEDSYRRVERLVDHIQANSDIKIIYPLQELLNSKDVLQLYLKTDTHWNEAGAFVGVQALYDLMGIPTTNITDVPHTDKPFTEGDLIRLGNLKPEDFPPDNNYTLDYKSEIGVTRVSETEAGDPYFETLSTSENDRNLVLIGDSYRGFMAVYLMRDFRQYRQIDKDYISDTQTCQWVQESDIIVIECVERFNFTLLNTVKFCCEYLKQMP